MSTDAEPAIVPNDKSTMSAVATPDFKVWRPPQIASGAPSTSHTLPESYFEPTTGEIMSLHQSRVTARERLIDAPLRTSAIREREEKKREAKYPTTTIRVKFPDQTQLERVFPSTDKIRSVYAFVRNSLREDVKPIKFVLYQTPPRREFKVSDPAVRDLSLYQLQLAPSSVLMLSFFDDSLNHRDVAAPLSEEILLHLQDLPPPPVFQELVPDTSNASTENPAGSSSQKKVPKWLKVGKK